MPKSIIVGFDGTAQSHRALDYAAGEARASDASLHLVLVIEWSPYSFHTPEELDERHKRREAELDRARAAIEPEVEKLSKSGLSVTCEVRHGNAGDLLCEIASSSGADQIVMGRTSDSPLSQRLLGGLAMTLAQIAPVPVTIVP